MTGTEKREARERLRQEIVKARKELGLTQFRLALEAKVVFSAVVRFEQTMFGPPLYITKNLLRITEALGIDLTDFGYDQSLIDSKRAEFRRQRKPYVNRGRPRLNTYPHADFGALLAEIRKASGLSQFELAEKMHVTPCTIASWEVGSKVPSRRRIAEWAALFKENAARWMELRAAEKEKGPSGVGAPESPEGKTKHRDYITGRFIHVKK